MTPAKQVLMNTLGRADYHAAQAIAWLRKADEADLGGKPGSAAAAAARAQAHATTGQSLAIGALVRHLAETEL